MSKAPFIQLNDGNRMPCLGLGTCAVRLHFFIMLTNHEFKSIFLFVNYFSQMEVKLKKRSKTQLTADIGTSILHGHMKMNTQSEKRFVVKLPKVLLNDPICSLSQR